MSGHPESWRDRPAAQQPDWPDQAELSVAVAELRRLPPLTLPRECDRLTRRLAEVARGRAFLLQGGDCAETFTGGSAAAVRSKIDTLQQMAVILTYATALPVVPIGRYAGQYAKPRSRPTETRDGMTLPVYRGDAVNGLEFTAAARRPDPARLVTAYHAAASTLNLVRGLTTGRDADRWLTDSLPWEQGDQPLAGRHRPLAREISSALRFVRAWGLGAANPVEFHASHEALLLDYESPLVRRDPRSGRWYAGSGHLLWIGDRTRDPAGAHVEFARTVHNPVAVKLGPSATPADVVALIERLDPDRRPGRLTFVSRLGATRVRELLPDLVAAAADRGAPVTWLCDPMHGNTVTIGGHKTRHFDDILAEIGGFFEVHAALGSHPGGLHLELTGEDVTECIGGPAEVRADQLWQRYQSACDPRLSRAQSVELAVLVAELYRDSFGGRSAGQPRPAAVGAG